MPLASRIFSCTDHYQLASCTLANSTLLACAVRAGGRTGTETAPLTVDRFSAPLGWHTYRAPRKFPMRSNPQHHVTKAQNTPLDLSKFPVRMPFAERKLGQEPKHRPVSHIGSVDGSSSKKKRFTCTNQQATCFF